MGAVTSTSRRSRPGKRRAARSAASATPTTAAITVAKVATSKDRRRGPHSTLLGRAGRRVLAREDEAIAVHERAAFGRAHVGGELPRAGGVLPALADGQRLVERPVQAGIDGRIGAVLL